MTTMLLVRNASAYPLRHSNIFISFTPLDIKYNMPRLKILSCSHD